MQHMLPGSRLRAALLVAVASALVGAAAHAQMAGAIFTTDILGQTNVNLYDSKEDVYINGGPAHPGAAGLPLGDYYIQVTTPNGDVLGSSYVPGHWDDTPIKVIAAGGGNGGAFEFSYRLWDIVKYLQGNTLKQGYKTSGNPGGVYKVWVSKDKTFPNNATKTDNFRLRQNPNQTEPVEINVYKYYDNDNSGDYSAGDEGIPGWKIELRRASNNNLVLTDYTDSSGKVTFLVNDDGMTYNVIEIMPLEGTSGPNVYWFALTPTSVQVIATNNPAPADVIFLNIAKELRHVNGFGRTKGWWGNNPNGTKELEDCYPHGWQQLLNSMCLKKNDGSDLVLTANNAVDAAEELEEWILDAALGNAKYILSTQLATLVLNAHCSQLGDLIDDHEGMENLFVMWGGVGPQYLVALDDFIAMANAMLCGNTATDAELLEIKDFIDGLNNNETPGGEAGPFSLYYWYPLPFIPPFSYS